jgi:hypothetical protein
MIELQRSYTETTDPFVGTDIIPVVLDFNACLTEFFETQPEYGPTGEAGEAVFDEWWEKRGRLCDPDEYPDTRPIPDCYLTDGVWNINTDGGEDRLRMVLTFVMEGDEIEGRYLPYGPLPTEHLAGCTPIVELTQPSVRGEDLEGGLLWEIAAFENAKAKTNQGAAIQIFVEN